MNGRADRPGDRPRARSTRPRDALSERERAVAGLVAQGLTNRQIAAQLFVSDRTVQSHVQHVLTKLGFSNRTQIASWMLERERPMQPPGTAVTIVHGRLSASGEDAAWLTDRFGAVASAYGGTIERIGVAEITCSFETTAAALRATVEAMLQDATERRGATSIDWCVAVHRGPLRRMRLGLVGAAIHESTRLAGAGHRGQVLVTEPALADLRSTDADEVTLAPLGTVTWRGSRPLGVHRLVHPRLRPVSTPLDAHGGMEHHLPRLGTTFVGRDAEVAEITGLIGDHRIVTLLGPGGCGKTRLAIEVGRSLTGRFVDGVLFVDLSVVDGVTDVGRHVLTALDADDAESLPAVLSGRDLLIVLDNCEHVLASAADAVTAMLDRCHGVRVLATSRQALGLGDEARFPVPPLAWPHAGMAWSEVVRQPAVELLEQRAKQTNPAFRLSPGDQSALIEFAAQVEGLALAIELAAARLRVLSLDQLCAELRDGSDVLSTTAPATTARHRSTRHAFDWTYRSLDAGERGVLGLLAYFAGSADLDGLDGGRRSLHPSPRRDRLETISIIESLVDKSVVTGFEVDGSKRYRLHPLIREYVLDSHTPSERDAYAGAHAGYFADLALHLGEGPPEGGDRQWIDRHDVERDNLRRAIEHWERRDPDRALRVLVDSEPGCGFVSHNDWWIDRLGPFAERSPHSDVDYLARAYGEVLFHLAETRDPRGSAVEGLLGRLLEHGLGPVARCAALAAITRWQRKQVGARPDPEAIRRAVQASDDAGGTYWPWHVRYMLSMDLPLDDGLELCRGAARIARQRRLAHFESLARASIAVAVQFTRSGPEVLSEWGGVIDRHTGLDCLAPTDACFYVLAEAEHGSLDAALPLAEHVALAFAERLDRVLGNEVQTVLARARWLAGDADGARSAIEQANRSGEPLWDFLGGLNRLVRSAIARHEGRPADGIALLGPMVADVGYRGSTDIGARTIEELAAIALQLDHGDLSADLLATAADLRADRGQPLSPAGERELVDLHGNRATSTVGRVKAIDDLPGIAAELAG